MTSDIIMGVVILVLILLSAFFSAIETAFSFVNKVRVQRYKDDGNKKAATALYIIEHFDNALTTILICNNVVNLSCSSIATVLCMNLFGDAGSAIATGATTFLVLTFGEIVPKCLAKEHCDAFSLKTAGLLRGLMTLLTPLVWIFTRFKMIALKIAGSSGDAPSVTENELKYIVESIEEEGVLEESESEMVRSALDFDETTALRGLTSHLSALMTRLKKSRISSLKTAIQEFPCTKARLTMLSVFSIQEIILNDLQTVKRPMLRSLCSRLTLCSKRNSFPKFLMHSNAQKFILRSLRMNTAEHSVLLQWRICSKKLSAKYGTRTKKLSITTTKSARASSL